MMYARCSPVPTSPRRHAIDGFAIASSSALLLLLFWAGCAGSGDAQASGSRERLTLDAFIASPGEVNGAGSSETAQDQSAQNPAQQGDDDDQFTAPVEVVTDQPAPVPPAARVPQITPGREVILDSMVGQINGRPIFAGAFFAPIDAKLRLAAETSTPLQFRETLEREVTEHLRDILESELILSQAQAQLTEQQQQGLFAFMAQRQDEFVLQTGGGSAEVARRRLFDEQGITMEDFMEDQRQRALIQLILQQEIAPRIVISWKDIEREYQAQYARYNPPGTVRVLRIWIDNAQYADLVEEVRERLAGGEPFMQVWEQQQPMHKTDNTYAVPTGGLAELTDLVPEFRDRLINLQPGETAEPFVYEMSAGPRTVWQHLAELNQPPGRSIYDEAVQLEIRNALYNQRFAQERLRYMQEQLGEDVMNDITMMTTRLVGVGEKRYAR